MPKKDDLYILMRDKVTLIPKLETRKDFVEESECFTVHL